MLVGVGNWPRRVLRPDVDSPSYHPGMFPAWLVLVLVMFLVAVAFYLGRYVGRAEVAEHVARRYQQREAELQYHERAARLRDSQS